MIPALNGILMCGFKPAEFLFINWHKKMPSKGLRREFMIFIAGTDILKCPPK